MIATAAMGNIKNFFYSKYSFIWESAYFPEQFLLKYAKYHSNLNENIPT